MRRHLQAISEHMHSTYDRAPIRLISIIALILIAAAFGYNHFYGTKEPTALIDPAWVERGTAITDPSGKISIRYGNVISPVFQRFELDIGEEEPILLMLKKGEKGSFSYRGDEYFLHLLDVDKDRGAEISIARKG
jgi:hypothetical protein